MSLRRFFPDTTGSSAAEFAIVLPLAMLFLFGIIDAGRYMWEVNKAEKATQVGARFAVVTDLVPSALINYSFPVSEGIAQGTVVPKSAFPGVSCTSSGCTCMAGGTCKFSTTANATTFTQIVDRMKLMKPDIQPANVVVDYAWSGLGFAGDPNGPDVAPLVTVRLTNLSFAPTTLMLFKGSLPIPSASYSLTLEDGQGKLSD